MNIKFAGMFTIKDTWSEVVEPGNRIGFNILEGTGMVRHYVTAKVLSNPDQGSLQYIAGSYDTETGEVTVLEMYPMRDYVNRMIDLLQSPKPDTAVQESVEHVMGLVAEYINYHSRAILYILGDNVDLNIKLGPITASVLYLQYRNFQMVFDMIWGYGKQPTPETSYDIFFGAYSSAMIKALRLLEFEFRMQPINPFSITNKKMNPNPMDPRSMPFSGN